MYNIAKVGKGEILVYFNNIFDQLCKVSKTFPRAFILYCIDFELQSWGLIRSYLSRMELNCWIV